MFGWKHDFVSYICLYSKLEVLGGETSPCFVPKKIASCTKKY